MPLTVPQKCQHQKLDANYKWYRWQNMNFICLSFAKYIICSIIDFDGKYICKRSDCKLLLNIELYACHWKCSHEYRIVLSKLSYTKIFLYFLSFFLLRFEWK